MWKDPDEAEDIEPLISEEPSLPAGMASPSPSPTQSEVINPSLSEENIMASTVAVSMQDNAEFPQDLPLPCLISLDAMSSCVAQKYLKK